MQLYCISFKLQFIVDEQENRFFGGFSFTLPLNRNLPDFVIQIKSVAKPADWANITYVTCFLRYAIWSLYR